MRSLRVFAPWFVALSVGCSAAPPATETPTTAAAPSTAPTSAPSPQDNAVKNPLLAPWIGPNGGVPPFGKFVVADLAPALEAAMREHDAEIDKIADDPSPPTFENTILALEAAGKALGRVRAVYHIYTGTMNDDAVQAVERDMSPKLTAHSDRITQNPRLWKRIAEVYDGGGRTGVDSKTSAPSGLLNAEQKRLVWVYYTEAARSGAKLDAAGKEALSRMNQRLATLYTTFSQNLLAEEGGQRVLLESEADLAGLPASLKESAASAAKASGSPGKWAISNTRSSVDPFLSYSTRGDLRQKVWKMFKARGDGGDAHDNNATIAEILKVRAERAKLLGYPTHAHWQLEATMAKTPERAVALMEAVWKPAVARVREEVKDMQAIADKEKGRPKIAPWDYRFYAEKVRKAKYDLEQNDVKPYLQLEKLREGMFWVAGELFGLRFAQVTDGSIAVYHPDVRVFEVTDAAGKHVGLWFFDPYARAGKSSGAWMNEYRTQSRFDGEVPVIVSNNANFIKAEGGAPVLISWDDARTLFHEFGHALHGLSSNVTYRSLAGTSVATDYVEFPSQLLERWLQTPEVLSRFALHVETGKPLPAELLKKLQKSETFNQGYTTMEYLASALVDMKLHLAGDKALDPRAFEKETLAALGMPSELAMRHRTAQFGHIFSGDEYSAGYYSYLWSDTLSTDAYEAFTEAGGPYDKKVAAKLHDFVFSVGNTVDPKEAYAAFRGREPSIDALMRHRGFPMTAAPSSKGAKKKP